MDPEQPQFPDLHTDDSSNRDAMDVSQTQPPRLPFTVVGMGASAGGLEAYIEFFDAMPSDSGMAFVLVQHLSPKRESMIAEILQKHTAMPVRQVEDGMAIHPNHVYIIRPGHTLTIKDGLLRLGDSLLTPGHSRPVDDFFRSLAEEQRERAVCVIFSGMGSNGSSGAQEVKVAGGVCIAQDPDTAKFPSMPRSLIDANGADFVLKVSEMPELLLRYEKQDYTTGSTSPEVLARNAVQQVGEILSIVRARSKYDFAGYKRPTLVRRIQRRMGLTQQPTLSDYAKLLRQSPNEVTNLSDDLLIHVTGFFRDGEIWETLKEKVIQPLVNERKDGGAIRAWVTACATGEEAYTLAMLLLETAETANKRFDIKVFATDMADRALGHARSGIFPGGIESELTPERLERFFEKEDGHYRTKRNLRDVVVFAPQNVMQDPPFSRLDIVTCRNLLIYLETEVQQKVLGLLHFGLREHGALVLGNSETLGDANDLFEPVDKKSRIYRRVGANPRKLADFPLSRPLTQGAQVGEGDETRSLTRVSLNQITQRALLERYTPPAVVVDRQGRIVYFHGNTELFLDQPRGEPTRDILALTNNGLRTAVRASLHKAVETGERVTTRDGLLEVAEGIHRVEVTVEPLEQRGIGTYFLVSFHHFPVTVPTSLGGGRHESEELVRIRDELQNTVEELQTSNEELKAANEEITSINEELQSSNEELETSKEELQSLNEELTTVNAQMEAKMVEAEQTTNDLTSLLTSTDIAVIFLDPLLRIRRYTPATKKLMDLIPTDVGRPLADLARRFDDPRLADDAKAVLDSLIPIEAVILSDSGRWYVRRVLPYRTTDNRIDGVVITFVDVSDRKRIEGDLAAAKEFAESIVQTLHEPLLVLREDLTVTRANAAFFADFNVSPEQTVGRKIYDLGNGQWNIPGLRTLLEDVLPANKVFNDYEVEHQFQSIGRRTMLLNARRLDQVQLILLGIRDVTVARQLAAADSQGSENQLKIVMASALDFAILLMNEKGVITQWNAGATELMGWSESEAIGQPGAMIFTPEDRAAGAPELEAQTALRDGRAPDERWHLRKDGSRFWGSGVMSVVRDEHGQHRGFVKVLRDTTARQQNEEDRARLLEAEQHARAQAEAANAAKDQFLANASHELRTPLSAILLWANLLKADDCTEQTREQAVNVIEQSAKAQQKLIEDLLDSARIATGKLSVEPRPADMRSAVRDAVAAMQPAAEAKDLELNADLGENIGHVLVDADRVQQVVWNLVSNAVKFTPGGGKINVGLRRRGETVEIRVADTGQGIAAEELPHIFTRFRQGDASITRRQSGLGLGLAISKQLVELHGGTITAASDGPGKGSTFTITLPLPRQKAGQRSRAKSPDAGGLENVTLLLIEDDASTRYVLTVMLGRAGANVVAFGHPEAAKKSFLAGRPDVIVSDIGLPDKDGYTLIRELRAAESPDAPRVPAVALTAFDRPSDQEQAMAAGFEAYLTKPVESGRLLAVIRQLLGR